MKKQAKMGKFHLAFLMLPLLLNCGWAQENKLLNDELEWGYEIANQKSVKLKIYGENSDLLTAPDSAQVFLIKKVDLGGTGEGLLLNKRSARKKIDEDVMREYFYMRQTRIYYKTIVSFPYSVDVRWNAEKQKKYERVLQVNCTYPAMSLDAVSDSLGNSRHYYYPDYQRGSLTGNKYEYVTTLSRSLWRIKNILKPSPTKEVESTDSAAVVEEVVEVGYDADGEIIQWPVTYYDVRDRGQYTESYLLAENAETITPFCFSFSQDLHDKGVFKSEYAWQYDSSYENPYENPFVVGDTTFFFNLDEIGIEVSLQPTQRTAQELELGAKVMEYCDILENCDTKVCSQEIFSTLDSLMYLYDEQLLEYFTLSEAKSDSIIDMILKCAKEGNPDAKLWAARLAIAEHKKANIVRSLLYYLDLAVQGDKRAIDDLDLVCTYYDDLGMSILSLGALVILNELKDAGLISTDDHQKKIKYLKDHYLDF